MMGFRRHFEFSTGKSLQRYRYFFYRHISIEMSCSGSKWFNPAQVFAQFTTSSDKEGSSSPTGRHGEKSTEENRKDAHNKHEIQITESAEISLPPDKAKVSINCVNSKVKMRSIDTPLLLFYRGMILALTHFNFAQNLRRQWMM